MAELSDEDVFGSRHEMSDADVMSPQAVSGFSGPDGVAVAKGIYPSLGPIMSAMGHGAKDGWGEEPLGLPPESVKWLSDKGIFGPEKGGYQNPFQAFNELLAH